MSDLHIGGSEGSVERAMRARGCLNGLPGPIDAVMVTGDIADHGLVRLEGATIALCDPPAHDNSSISPSVTKRARSRGKSTA